MRFTSANMLQRHMFEFLPERDAADYVSSGRLREVKNNRKCQTVGRGRLREVPSIQVVIDLKTWYFGKGAN